jgi:hypothetical protein
MICHIRHHRAAASLADIRHKFHHEITRGATLFATASRMARQRHLGVVRAKPPLQPKAATLPACTCSKCTCSRALCSTRAGQGLARGIPVPRCLMSVLRNLQNFQEVAICGGDFLGENLPRNKRIQLQRPVDPSLPNADTSCGSNRLARGAAVLEIRPARMRLAAD